MLIFSKSFFKSMHTRLEKSDRIMRYSRYPLDPPLREPGKRCLPKWYIENTNDYITLMLYIDLVLDSKNIQFHIIWSFYYSISINSIEVDHHSNSLHNGIVKPKNIVNMMKTKNLFKAPFINSI